MPATDTDAARPGLRCSFCANATTDVAKMIAGPGVYICDRCVDACNTVLTENAPPAPSADDAQIPAWHQMSEAQILDRLPGIAAVGLQIESSLRVGVGHLRERGVTWERIGAALGITRQAAWARFPTES